MALRSLHLFAGAGGGCLADVLLGHDIVCYVERDEYCCRVLEQRIRDGFLPDAPIWDDVCTFNAHEWQGQVDVVSGGFPCQAFSTAARGRNYAIDLWPEMLRVVEDCQTPWVFAENVQRAPIERAAADLRGLGFVVRFGNLAASDLGAPHGRPRWWLVANTNRDGQPRCSKHGQVARVCDLSVMAQELWGSDYAAALGMDDGLAHRMDRLRAIGNGQVPLVAATAWHLLRRGG